MIRVLEAFSGMGAQHKAISRIGIDYQIVGTLEIDNTAIKAYQVLHGDVKNFGDITTINPEEIPEFDFMSYSFPCFIKDTLVFTDNGHKCIQDVNVGDYVLTHNNRFRRVTKTYIKKTNELVNLNIMGSHEIVTTPEHPFYVRRKTRKYIKRKHVRLFGEPEWLEAKNLSNDYYVGIAVNTQSIIPKWDGVTFEWNDKRKSRHCNELSNLLHTNDFWYLIGRYIGDGWVRHSGGIIICDNVKHYKSITDVLERINVNYSVAIENTVAKVHIGKKEWSSFVEQFGKGAKNKHLTSTVLDLPKHLLESFLDGYVDSDGHVDKKGCVNISSVSKRLIYDVCQCVYKVYGVGIGVGKYMRPNTCVIEGRVVNQNPSYSIRFKKHTKKQDNSFYEDGYVWVPFHSKSLEYKEEVVYNLEVDEDNSYTIYNNIVHNCTSLSMAGKREGMSKDSNTKSSLLWECDKIISHHRPKYLMMENVTQILSDAHKVDFDAWKSILKSYGYNNYVYKLMASDFGVPQRRERVFMISILKEYDYGYADSKVIEEDNFHIHHKKKNPKFKSVMDKNVDKKYYDIPGFLLNNPKRPPRFFTENDSIPTLTTKMLNAWNCGFIKDANGSRYVTPLEAVRLMGFDDSDYRKLRKNFSDHQIYKLCGNSIVVNVLEVIFAQLFRKEM